MSKVKRAWVYDIETYPNLFSVVFEACEGEDRFTFALWDEEGNKDVSEKIRGLAQWMRENCSLLVGFNNVGFDWPVVSTFHDEGTLPTTIRDIYLIAQSVIDVRPRADRNPIIPQMDLMRIWHYDNKNKMTSLKWLEFTTGNETVDDLPYKPGTYLTKEQAREVVQYNRKDVTFTKRFMELSQEAIEARRSLGSVFKYNFMNASDSSMGEIIVRNEYMRSTGATWDEIQPPPAPARIRIDSLIFDYVKFKSKEFNYILNEFKGASVFNGVSGGFKREVIHDGLEYVAGLGGAHASRKGEFLSNKEVGIWDIDVKSYYPNLSIKNRFYPSHLGEVFCDILEGLYNKRVEAKAVKPATPQSKALDAGIKKGLNSVYGKSGDMFSFLYDPSFQMRTAVNGQLLLMMLAERMVDIGLTILQANTDGITIMGGRSLEPQMREIYHEWEELTMLELEEVQYKSMWLRDVNNYMAVGVDGKVKLKGIFEIDKMDGPILGYHKDWSMRVVPLAVREYLVNGVPVEETVHQCEDMLMFACATRSRGGDSMYLQSGLEPAEKLQKTFRYYYSKRNKGGKFLIKELSNNLKKSTLAYRRSVTEMRETLREVPEDLDHQFYIGKAKELIAKVKPQPTLF